METALENKDPESFFIAVKKLSEKNISEFVRKQNPILLQCLRAINDAVCKKTGLNFTKDQEWIILGVLIDIKALLSSRSTSTLHAQIANPHGTQVLQRLRGEDLLQVVVGTEKLQFLQLRHLRD